MSDERDRRWRLIFGEEAGPAAPLSAVDLRRDAALAALYDDDRSGGTGSGRQITRWLGELRDLFPASVVQVVQRDALERLDLARVLSTPELVEQLQPDVHLAATLVALSDTLSDDARAVARGLVRQVVDALLARLEVPTVSAVRGSLNRASRTARPRPDAIDWHGTIRRNLRHYRRGKGLVVERLVGYGRRHQRLRDLVLCVDQSGSMAPSLVHAAVLASVLARLPALRTRLAVFDTEVVELTEHLDDAVDVLFAAQLGGGTDIGHALGWCLEATERPERTIVVLITDLEEGGDRGRMLARADALVATGATVVCLLALSDDGTPAFDARNARAFASLGIATFATTPDTFPELMSAAIVGRDLARWAAERGIPGPTS